MRPQNHDHLLTCSSSTLTTDSATHHTGHRKQKIEVLKSSSPQRNLLYRQHHRIYFLPLLHLLLLGCCVGPTLAVGPETGGKTQTLATVSSDGKVVYGPKSEVPNDKLFQDPAAYCEGCYGFSTEVHKLLLKWRSEPGSMQDHIDAAFLASCSTDRLNKYVLSPPKMSKLCTGILAHFEEELSLALLELHTKHEQPSQEQMFAALCRDTVRACRRGSRPMTVVREEERRKSQDKKKQEL